MKGGKGKAGVDSVEPAKSPQALSRRETPFPGLRVWTTSAVAAVFQGQA